MMRVTCAPRLVAKTSRIAWLNTARIAHQKRVTCFNVNRLFSSVDITKPTDSENSQDSTSHRAIVSEDGIAGLVGYTPLVRLNRVAEKCKAKVYAKMEGMNPGGELKAAPATRTRPRINGLTNDPRSRRKRTDPTWGNRACRGHEWEYRCIILLACCCQRSAPHCSSSTVAVLFLAGLGPAGGVRNQSGSSSALKDGLRAGRRRASDGGGVDGVQADHLHAAHPQHDRVSLPPPPPPFFLSRF
eukprot:1056040-Rhodomonas_salina.1